MTEEETKTEEVKTPEIDNSIGASVLNFHVMANSNICQQIEVREPGKLYETDFASIKFQDGNPKDVGRNGFTFEELIAVCIHRIGYFKEEKKEFWNNHSTDKILESLAIALKALHTRTKDEHEGHLI